MPRPEPFRGEVWDVDFETFGTHPAVVLSINALNSRPGHVAVIPITGTSGPTETHIPLGADAGLTEYDQSYADVTSLQLVARVCLLRQRGLVHRSELDRVARQLSIYLGL